MEAELICYVLNGRKDLELSDEGRQAIIKRCAGYTSAVRAGLEQLLLALDPNMVEFVIEHELLGIDNADEGPNFSFVTTPTSGDLPTTHRGSTLKELRSDERYEELIAEAREKCGIEPDATADEERISRVLHELEQVWENGARDVDCRQDPDDPEQQIVVSGALSWGEVPEGDGFCIIDAARVCRLFAALGIR